MKTLKTLAVAALFVGAMTAGSLVHAADAVPTAAPAVAASTKVQEHLDMSAKYEKLAAEQQALIDEHVKMKAENRKRFPPKSADMMAKEMDKHCDTLIAVAKKEKASLTEFAKWHKMRAAELQGK